MASSGTIYGSTNNQYIDAKITWSIAQNIAGNYSTVHAILYYSRNNTGYTTSGTWTGKIVINGHETSGSKYLSITYNSNTQAIEAWVDVPHNSDGTKTITISASGGTTVSTLKSTNISGSVTLDTIPRASSVTMSTDGTMDSPFSITINRASSSFTHTLQYYFGTKVFTIVTKTASTSLSWTPKSSDLATEIPNAIRGVGNFVCTTYNGNTVIGTHEQLVYLNLPASVKPSVGSLTLTPATMTLLNPETGLSTSNTINLLVQNKNKLTLAASNVSPGYGSTIAYYTFSGPSYSAKVTSTSNSCSTTVSSVASTGTLTYQVTATDSRGRTSDAVTKTITCHAYSAPSLSSFTAYRANSNGQPDESGSYLKCTYSSSYSSVNGQNGIAVRTYYNGAYQIGSDNSVLIDLKGDTSTTYKVYLTIRDKFGGYKATSTKIVYGAFRILNITSDGTGVAIGKKAEGSNKFESRWPAKINGDISFGQNELQGRLTTEQTDEQPNIVFLLTGVNADGGTEAGLAIQKNGVYVPNKGNSGRLNLGLSEYKWNQLYAANGTISTSDARVKQNIERMGGEQEEFFNKLNPVTFEFTNGTSGRTHYGFISQDVEDALYSMGLTGNDFAGFCKDSHVDENGEIAYDYSLRYSEFIALNTYMIQKLQHENEQLKYEVKQLKDAMYDLVTRGD